MLDIGLALEHDRCGHALHLQIVGAGNALLYLHVASHKIKGKTLAKDIAEV